MNEIKKENIDNLTEIKSNWLNEIKTSEGTTLDEANDIFDMFMDKEMGEFDRIQDSSDFKQNVFLEFYDDNKNRFEGKTPDEVYCDMQEKYEFFDEWLEVSQEGEEISLEDFNEKRCVEEYGDEDSFDDELSFMEYVDRKVNI